MTATRGRSFHGDPFLAVVLLNVPGAATHAWQARPIDSLLGGWAY